MRATRMQTTVAETCSVSGRGYWSGVVNTLTFLPARAGTGIQFVRTDLPGRPRVQAVTDHRVSMQLRTRLIRGDAEVDMVEHVLAALYGLQIDNVEVLCTAAEMPGLDGSCFPIALALHSAGRTELQQPRPYLTVTESFQIGGTSQFVRIEPSDRHAFEVEYQLDYGNSSSIGQATHRTALEPEEFASRFMRELAPARTFVTQAEAAALQNQGLGTHVTDQDLLVFDENGPINNSLRFTDECARHKALDLIGDLALAGIDLVGRVIARKSGHQMNGQMAQHLREMFQRSDLSCNNENRDAA